MPRKSYVSLLALGAGLFIFGGTSLADVRIKLEPYVTGSMRR
jgi:hypothetical protein